MFRLWQTLCVLIPFVIFLITLSPTKAVNTMTANRTPGASVAADDASGSIGLSGFNGDTYTLANAYQALGTVTNRFGLPLSLTVNVDPNVTQACRSYGTSCTAGQYSLYFCLATDRKSEGGNKCMSSPGGQSTELVFTDTGTSDPGPQSTASLSVAPDQTLYLLSRLTIRAGDSTQTFCGQATFAFDGASNSGSSISISSSGSFPRLQIYVIGVNC